MGPVLSPGIVVGIAVGASLLIFLPVILVVTLRLRIRHKKLLARINESGGRRLRKYPRNNLEVVDQAALSYPSGTFTRRSALSPHGNLGGWAAVASRESLPSYQKSRIPRVRAVQETKDATRPAWPLPARLTRSKKMPLARAQRQAASSTAEPPPNSVGVTPNLPDVAELPTGTSRTHTPEGVDENLKEDGTIEDPFSFQAAALKPRPLFHDQRSASSGSISKPLNGIVESRGIISSHGLAKAHFRRSTSLTSQQPGLAPTFPIPPLPSSIQRSAHFQRFRVSSAGSPSRTSMVTDGSDGTSVLDNGDSRSLSQTETDFTSIGFLSPASQVSGTQSSGLFDGANKLWDASALTIAPTSSRPSATAQIQHQFLTSRSHRASIGQYILPRSETSGVSTSLLDQHPNPHISQSSNIVSKQSDVGEYTALVKTNRPRRDDGAQIPEANLWGNDNPTSKPCDDLKKKRASTSILQEISGNKNSPMLQTRKRPSSIATSNPFQWSSEKSSKTRMSSPSKNRKKGHKRQNCIRLSNLEPVFPSQMRLPILEEPGETPKATAVDSGVVTESPRDQMRRSRTLSQHTTESEVNPLKLSRTFCHFRSEGPGPPTVSTEQAKDKNNTSSTSESFRAPTSNHSPSTRLIPSQFRSQVSSTTVHFKPPSPPSAIPGLFQQHLSPTEFSTSQSLPPSLLRQFPRIRGPRVQPSRSPSRRAPAMKSTGPVKDDRTRDVQKCIVALRRMNSGVSDLDAEESKAYFRMGLESSVLKLDEKEETHLRDGEAVRRTRGDLDARLTEGVGNHGDLLPEGSSTPGGLYDRDGFLL